MKILLNLLFLVLVTRADYPPAIDNPEIPEEQPQLPTTYGVPDLTPKLKEAEKEKPTEKIFPVPLIPHLPLVGETVPELPPVIPEIPSIPSLPPVIPEIPSIPSLPLPPIHPYRSSAFAYSFEVPFVNKPAIHTFIPKIPILPPVITKTLVPPVPYIKYDTDLKYPEEIFHSLPVPAAPLPYIKYDTGLKYPETILPNLPLPVAPLPYIKYDTGLKYPETILPNLPLPVAPLPYIKYDTDLKYPETVLPNLPLPVDPLPHIKYDSSLKFPEDHPSLPLPKERENLEPKLEAPYPPAVETPPNKPALKYGVPDFK